MHYLPQHKRLQYACKLRHIEPALSLMSLTMKKPVLSENKF